MIDTGSPAVEPSEEHSLEPAARPQGLITMLFGVHLPETEVSTQTLVAALELMGHREHAVRTALSRMVSRGMLRRRTRGRRSFFRLSDETREVARTGRQLIWRTGPHFRDWDGCWTAVAFSMPNGDQRQRRDLRSLLGEHGFGMIRDGFWVTPHQVDIASVTRHLGIDHTLTVIRGTLQPPASAKGTVAHAYDLATISDRYRRFIDIWQHDIPEPAISAEMRLSNHWLYVLRRDPRLPVELLPADWPATAAEEVYRRRYAEWHAKSIAWLQSRGEKPLGGDPLASAPGR